MLQAAFDQGLKDVKAGQDAEVSHLLAGHQFYLLSGSYPEKLPLRADPVDDQLCGSWSCVSCMAVGAAS
jgi:hypothetical protein